MSNSSSATEAGNGREYDWYVAGCARFGWTPLLAEEFWPRFLWYRRSSRAIQKFERRRASRKGFGGLLGTENRTIERILRNVIRERDQWDFLATAVAAGQSAESASVHE